MEDRVLYAPPLGIFGRLANQIFIKDALRAHLLLPVGRDPPSLWRPHRDRSRTSRLMSTDEGFLTASTVPAMRVIDVNREPLRLDRDYVLYWMTAFRRMRYNFALQRALEWARELRKPLIVLEALRVDYRWASDRLHRFILDGMADNRAEFAQSSVAYYPYVEPAPRCRQGPAQRLAVVRCVVVADDFPAFFLPRAVARRRPPARRSCGSGRRERHPRPSRTGQRVRHGARFPALAPEQHLRRPRGVPAADPLAAFPTRRADVPAAVTIRWPIADLAPAATDTLIRTLPLDHSVSPVDRTGGSRAAAARLRDFIGNLCAVRRRAQPSGQRRWERVVTLSALRPHLVPRGIPRRRERRGLVRRQPVRPA